MNIIAMIVRKIFHCSYLFLNMKKILPQSVNIVKVTMSSDQFQWYL